MFPRLFPEIPEALAALTDEALASLLAEFRAVSARLRAGEIDLAEAFGDAYTTADEASAEAMAQWTAAAEFVAQIRAEQESRVEAVAAFAETADELHAAFGDDTEPETTETPEATEDEVEEPSGDASAEAETPEDETEPESTEVEPVPEPVVAAAGPRPVRFPATPRRHEVREPDANGNSVALVAAAGLTNAHVEAGARLSLREYAEKALQVARWRGRVDHVQGGGRERILVASAQYEYPEERRLVARDGAGNAEKIAAAGNYFLRSDDEIMQHTEAMLASGGICAPPTPIYTLPDLETRAMPVRNGGFLTAFQADRGGVSLPSVDTIGDVGVGVGGATGNAITIITATEDETGGTVATKSCQRVDCADWTDTFVTTIAHCRQVGNLNARTWPEGVAKANSLTLAAQARASEGYLLDRIDALSVKVDGGVYYGAISTIIYRLVLSRVGIISRLRLPEDTVFNALLPFWAAEMASLDVVGSEYDRFDTGPARLAAILRDHNINVIYHLDEGLAAGGSHDDEIFNAQADGAQVDWPATKLIARLAPAGTFMLLDGGDLELGLIRDSTLNETNDYELFGEEFLNVARMGPAEVAHRVEMTVCPDGTVAPRATSAFTCSAS